MDFLSKIYGSEYFGAALVVIIIILIVLFILFLVLGKKDEKKRNLEKTQSMDKDNINAMVEVNKEPTALEVPAQEPATNDENVIGSVESASVNNFSNPEFNPVTTPSSEVATEPAVETPATEPVVAAAPVNETMPVNNPTVDAPAVNNSVENAYNTANDAAQNVNNNFNDIAVSINQELNAIDDLKENKDALINNQSMENNLGVTFEKPDLIDEPVNSFAVVEPVIDTPAAPVETPVVENQVAPEPAANAYVAPTSTYSQTPYKPTTQFSSVNVAPSALVEPVAPVAPTEPADVASSFINEPINSAASNMEYSVNNFNTPVNNPAVENVTPETQTENVNQPVQERKMPSGFEMPMLNPNLVKDDTPQVQKPATGPSFSFESDDSNSFNI